MCTPQGIIEKVGCLAFDEAVKAAIKAGKYVLNYTTNLEKLQVEMRSLEACSKIIETKVGEANDRGEEVGNAVLHWRANADGMKNDVQELMAQSSVTGNISCFTCSCPNIKRRYKLSKEAEEKKEDVQKLTQDSHFDEISHPRPPPPELEFRSNKNYVNLDSRTPVFNDIIKALKDPSVNIVGIYGLGGVGKTTLAEQVSKEMRKDGTFKQVPLVAVSKDLNVEEIQSKLADRLDFTLNAAVGEKGRASQLWNKFTNGEKYLVILDDIWREVDIEAIGIPIKDGKTGCKVLLTSRNEDLMIKMEVDRSFSIAELRMPEAWTLFKKLTGNSIDESRTEMCSLAYEVCKKCKGLPVAINALGAALKNKPYPVWKNALDKLERYMITNIEGIDPSVWASLKLSYDVLWSSDAKSCFLLCCLYPEDFEIPIEHLMRQCVARRLLSQNPRTLDEARNAACTVVQSLKSASLLSYGNDENFVRIHDVIRDVGISIAFKEKAFLVDHGALQWPRNPINGPPYSAISLRLTKIKGLSNELTCPQLHTLIFFDNEQSHLEVPDNFFSGMKQLVVLIVARMQMGRLPSSLANLASLGMLCLEHCELADIAILGDLKNSLEVLSLRGSTIEALPQEIGQLTRLLLLDLRGCEKLNVIPQGVISNLTSLEELYLPDEFDQWEATEDNRRDTSIQKVTLEEIRLSLSTGQLTTLHIHIPNVMLLPKEGLKFENLKRFRISMGSKFEWHEHFPGTRVLKYEGSSLKKEFIPLVDKAETLYLSGIKGLKNVFDDRGVGNEFLDLKCLKVESCDDDLEYLIGEPKSSVRSHGLHPLQSLTMLVIENCKLKYLFSPSSARGLVNLEQLIVKQCEIMEAIVGFEGQKEENEIIFSKLKELHLEGLPNLKCFYAENEKTRTSIGSSFARVQTLFNEKVILPVLEELKVEALDSIEEIWDKQSPSVYQETESFGQLRDITVEGCKKLMNLVPSNILPRLRNLQFLVVNDCPNVEFVVFKNEKGEEEVADDSTLIIPQLSYLRIWNMERLKRFCSSSTTSNAQSLFNHQVIFPALENLNISGVDNIIEIWDKQSITVFEAHGSFCQLMNVHIIENLNISGVHKGVGNEFLDLKYLKVESCDDDLEYLLGEPKSSVQSHGLYPFKHLTDLIVEKCKLKYLLSPTTARGLVHLEHLRVESCESMEEIVGFEGQTDGNELILSKLKRLYLQRLPNLTSFYAEKEKTQTPMESSSAHAQPLFTEKVILPVLEDLKVTALGSIEEIWDKQPPSVNRETASFSQLRNITVEWCTKLMNLVPSNILPRLQNLQFLVVSDCPNVEFIVFKNKKGEEEVADDSTLIIPQLRSLRIWEMKKLKRFYSSSTTSNAQSLFNHQVIFPVLEKLNISGVDNIIEIWDKLSITVFEAHGSFCQLMNVQVLSCNKLTHLFPSKTHRLLKNLKTLDVRNCETMEGVVGFEGDVDEDGHRNEQVCFNKLTSLSLWTLPKLVSFCTKMGEAGTTEGNPTIHAQPLFNGKVAFLALEEITIENVPKIKEIWDKQPLSEAEKEAISFCNLRCIDVRHCDQLVYVFPSSMLPQLQNLQKLVITNCKEMEVIISNKLKQKEATNNNIILFAELKTVKLQFLPNLKRLCSETQLSFSNKDAFPALEINTIEVAIKDRLQLWLTSDTSSIDPDLIFLVNGTSRKEGATEESGTSSKVEDNNDHNKEEEEDGEEDVKNADNNEGGRGGGEEKDDEGGGGD